jgi:hypothetical protein
MAAIISGGFGQEVAALSKYRMLFFTFYFSPLMGFDYP